MILPVDNDFRIKGDQYSWSIQKSRKKKGEIVWESFKWFQSLESTVDQLGKYMVRTSDAQTLDEALLVLESVTTKLTLALSPKFKLTLVYDPENLN